MNKRITKHTLRALVTELNDVLGRPQGLFDLGHLTVDCNHMGYQLEEETSGRGTVYNHTLRLSCREMYYLLHGMIQGAKIQKGPQNG